MSCGVAPDHDVRTVMTDAGSALGAGHQAWMMNEVNALIWPSPDGIGVLNPIFYQQTVRVAKNTGILTADPDLGAYDQTIAQAAIAGLTDDLNGTAFVKATVAITRNAFHRALRTRVPGRTGSGQMLSGSATQSRLLHHGLRSYPRGAPTETSCTRAHVPRGR